MKTITRYEADDGTEFTDQPACLRYEQLAKQYNSLVQALIHTPEKCNWDGYVQQDRATVLSVQRGILELGKQEIGEHKWIAHTIANPLSCHSSWCDRLFSDGGSRALNRAWHRIACIDFQNFREYNQPFYANNPDSAVQKRVNP